MDIDELRAWLRLSLTPGVGPLTARRLLAHHGLPQTWFDASPLAPSAELSAAQAQALAVPPEGLQSQLEKTWQWLQEALPGTQRTVLTLGDARYPQALLDIPDPPLMLYAMGRLDLPLHSTHCLAVVGSRNPTPQGALNARQLACALAQAGVTIVSGLALGIDGAAHQGALDGGAGADALATVAVVGTGLDRVYPRQHHALAHAVTQHGWLVSEYPLGTPPLAANFPRRNRLIAGLSQSTLVVEAALKSGSLITARLAAEQGKEVFALPGSIHAPQARGCHALIRDGAQLVESAQDVLDALPTLARRSVQATQDAVPRAPQTEADATATDPQDLALLQALGYDPVDLDTLQARTGLPTPRLQARLMALELLGQLVRLPGGLFQRIALA